MAIRKEQILFACAVAFGAWYWLSLTSQSLPTRLISQSLDAPATAEVLAVLAAEQPNPALPARGSFDEPTESAPLPPRELPFPALAALPVVLPPLDPGQLPGHYHQLRMVAEPVEHSFGELVLDQGSVVVEGSGDEVSSGTEVASAGAGAAFDKLHHRTKGVLPVVLLDVNKFELAKTATITQPIRYQWMRSADGEVGVIREETVEGKDVERIELADTLENRVGMTEFELRKRGPALIPDRKRFIDFLLANALEHPELYTIAEQQTQWIIEDGDALDGYRWLQRVLRAQGAIGREWQLYREGSVPPALQDSSLLHRGRGELFAMLTLWRDAERELRRSVEVTPSDARSLAALAEFLLDRGDAAAALPFAERANQNRVRIDEPDDAYHAGAVLVEVQLALGRIDEANNAVQRLSAQPGEAADLAYLRGAVAYARGEFDRAANHFRDAIGKGDLPAARLGLGLCALATRRFDEARAELAWTAARAPLLRARAHTGLALLYEVTGHPDLARQSADNALLAAPRDPYALYVSGRVHRLAGAHGESVETMRRALAERDDLIEALASISTSLAAQAASVSENDAADLLARAARYADRAVQLDAERGAALVYIETQGLVKFRLGEMAGAREAFQRAAERGSDMAQIALAVIDYRQKRTSDAREALLALAQDPGRQQPTRDHARQLVDLIDDHAGKEQVRDSFDRAEVGEVWERKNSGQVVPRIADEQLVFQGAIKSDAAYLRRTLQKSGGFLKAATTVRLAPRTSVRFAGLQLLAGARAGAFNLRVGIYQGTQELQPFVALTDGNTGDETASGIALDVAGFDPHAEQRIEVEVVEGPRPSTFAMQIWWNGQLVHTFDELRSLRPNTMGVLFTDLIVEGRGDVDVRFDEFRLNRRSET